jgi:hypothetical protein
MPASLNRQSSRWLGRISAGRVRRHSSPGARGGARGPRQTLWCSTEKPSESNWLAPGCSGGRRGLIMKCDLVARSRTHWAHRSAPAPEEEHCNLWLVGVGAMVVGTSCQALGANLQRLSSRREASLQLDPALRKSAECHHSHIILIFSFYESL